MTMLAQWLAPNASVGSLQTGEIPHDACSGTCVACERFAPLLAECDGCHALHCGACVTNDPTLDQQLCACCVLQRMPLPTELLQTSEPLATVTARSRTPSIVSALTEEDHPDNQRHDRSASAGSFAQHFRKRLSQLSGRIFGSGGDGTPGSVGLASLATSPARGSMYERSVTLHGPGRAPFGLFQAAVARAADDAVAQLGDGIHDAPGGRAALLANLEKFVAAATRGASGAPLDISRRVKIKIIEDCALQTPKVDLVLGVAFSRDVAHRRMSLVLVQPRVVLLGFSLAPATAALAQLASLDELIEHQPRFLQAVRDQVVALGATLVVTADAMPQMLADLLAAAGVTAVASVKARLLARLATMSGAAIVASPESLVSPVVVGRFKRFSCRKFRPLAQSQPPHAVCIVERASDVDCEPFVAALVRGALPRRDLRLLKRLLARLLPAAYDFFLQNALFDAILASSFNPRAVSNVYRAHVAAAESVTALVSAVVVSDAATTSVAGFGVSVAVPAAAVGNAGSPAGTAAAAVGSIGPVGALAPPWWWYPGFPLVPLGNDHGTLAALTANSQRNAMLLLYGCVPQRISTSVHFIPLLCQLCYYSEPADQSLLALVRCASAWADTPVPADAMADLLVLPSASSATAGALHTAAALAYGEPAAAAMAALPPTSLTEAPSGSTLARTLSVPVERKNSSPALASSPPHASSTAAASAPPAPNAATSGAAPMIRFGDFGHEFLHAGGRVSLTVDAVERMEDGVPVVSLERLVQARASLQPQMALVALWKRCRKCGAMQPPLLLPEAALQLSFGRLLELFLHDADSFHVGTRLCAHRAFADASLHFSQAVPAAVETRPLVERADDAEMAAAGQLPQPLFPWFWRGAASDRSPSLTVLPAPQDDPREDGESARHVFRQVVTVQYDPVVIYTVVAPALGRISYYDSSVNICSNTAGAAPVESAELPALGDSPVAGSPTADSPESLERPALLPSPASVPLQLLSDAANSGEVFDSALRLNALSGIWALPPQPPAKEPHTVRPDDPCSVIAYTLSSTTYAAFAALAPGTAAAGRFSGAMDNAQFDVRNLFSSSSRALGASTAAIPVAAKGTPTENTGPPSPRRTLMSAANLLASLDPTGVASSALKPLAAESPAPTAPPEPLTAPAESSSETAAAAADAATHPSFDFGFETVRVTCKVYYARQFGALRRALGCAAASFVQSLETCAPTTGSGGKSRSVFYATSDGRFLLKSVTRSQTSAFLKLAPAYFDYMRSEFGDVPSQSAPQTLLAKIVGLYSVQIRRPGTTMLAAERIDLLVMESVFFQCHTDIVFDLKGSRRNRHVKNSKKGDVLLDDNWLEHITADPVYVSVATKQRLRAALLADSQFLAALNVMDYSLLVGIDRAQGRLHLGIVDYIQTYNFEKKVESWVKESGILGGGTTEAPTVISPRQYKVRFRQALDRAFIAIPG